MLGANEIVSALEAAGFTHLVWIPDSHLGKWESHLRVSKLAPVRVCREGEAVGVAAGLMLGGARPLVVVQCTGFFEAGDAIRNVVHDMKLPLKLIIGVRGELSARSGKSSDNCPHFAETLVNAWDLPCDWFDPFTATDCAAAIRQLANAQGAKVLLWGE